MCRLSSQCQGSQNVSRKRFGQPPILWIFVAETRAATVPQKDAVWMGGRDGVLPMNMLIFGDASSNYMNIIAQN